MKQYNILWLFSDEHRGQAMGCAGDTNIKTPHLDALAAQGTRFSHTYSVSPLCAPFRASVYTGQPIHTHGVGCLHRPIMSGVPVVPALLQQGGYHTIHIGKWHLSGGAAPSHFVAPCFRPGWDEWFGWENSNQPFATKYSTGTAPHMKQLDGYQTDACTDLASDFLDRAKDDATPWFMVLSVEPPHDPHIAPPEYMAQFETIDLAFRPNVPETWKTPENLAKMRGYYAQIKNLDDNIGRLLAKLKETGQDENTIIFYFSDHGDYMGSHGRAAKFFAQEESSNIPLIIRHPDAAAKGVLQEGLVSGLDIPATTLSMAGLCPPPHMYGADITDMLCDEAKHINRDVLIELDSFFDDGDPFYRYRALRTPTHLYVNAPLPERCMLYDMVNDPYQMNNLYGNPAHQAQQSALRELLAVRLVEAGDDYTLN